MAYKDNKHTEHGSAAGAAWFLVVTVIALLVLTVLYWASDHNDTASKNSGSRRRQRVLPSTHARRPDPTRPAPVGDDPFLSIRLARSRRCRSVKIAETTTTKHFA